MNDAPPDDCHVLLSDALKTDAQNLGFLPFLFEQFGVIENAVQALIYRILKLVDCPILVFLYKLDVLAARVHDAFSW